MFLKCFYGNKSDSHDSLNIVVILDPVRDLLSAKCAQFP